VETKITGILMIKKMRKLIAYQLSLFLILISFGLLKPNYSEKPTVSTPTFKNKSEISCDLDEDLNRNITESFKAQ
jgi:hypothetical protein